jgi:hypothetical protein
MPDANVAAAPKAGSQKMITELKVSGHLMTLDTGLFCIVQTPTRGGDPAAGLPGVRISHPPGPLGRPEAVSISTFRPDGWLYGMGDAALVRVLQGPAQILVTIYQAPEATDGAPNLQVLRLLEPKPAGARQQRVMEMIAHVAERGDVGAMLGDWLGERGSKRWIEGFGIAPTAVVTPKDIEYQAVLGRGWLSPWVEGGQFCGSRGMALPILGLRLRLRGPAADTHEAFYSASFVDGTAVGPVAAGEPCEAESLAPIEAFQVVIRPRGGAAAPAPAAPAVAAPAAASATPTAKPAPAAAKPAPAAALGRKKPAAKPAPAPKRR